MIVRLAGAAVLAAVIAGCGGTDDAPAPVAEPTTEQITLAGGGADIACEPVERMPLEGRASPYDSTLVNLGDVQAKLCYGRPSAREREIFGGLVPYDTLWRTGANEPTTLHTPVAADIAGLSVEPGSYTLYTVPGQNQWTVIVNRSTSQWGIESQYTPEVRAQEVGRAQVPAEQVAEHEEVFTITSEPAGANAADIVLRWENTRVRIPVRRT